jgi:hypothetical protein
MMYSSHNFHIHTYNMLALINHLSVDVLRIVQRASLFLNCLVDAKPGKSFYVILEIDDDVKIKRRFAHIVVKSRREEAGKKSVFFNKNRFRVDEIVYRPSSDPPFLVRGYDNKYYPLKTIYDVSCFQGRSSLAVERMNVTKINTLTAHMRRHELSLKSLGDGNEICREFNEWQDTMCYSRGVTSYQRQQSSAAIQRMLEYFDDLKKKNEENTDEFQRVLRQVSM